MKVKSERLKKLEVEIEDLQQWLKLGLVPKKDIEKHQEEIQTIKSKIEEEKERLRFLKENGELEEYVTPKKNPARQAYPDHTLPDMEAEGGGSMTDTGLEETEGGFETESAASESETASEGATLFEDEEDPFSDRNRWKRGIMEDPDADNW